MRLDPAVARCKFDREVERIKAQASLLQGWGCIVVRVEYPHVDAIFLPRAPLRILVPALVPQQANGVVHGTQVQLLRIDLPMFAGQPFGVRVDLSDFDQRAPGVTFHNARTWELLPYEMLPRGHSVDEHGQPKLVVLNGHPTTKRPFLCMRGIREYHEHPQHSGDEWALYRDQGGLFATLMVVQRSCVEGAHPMLALQPSVPHQVAWQAVA